MKHMLTMKWLLWTMIIMAGCSKQKGNSDDGENGKWPAQQPLSVVNRQAFYNLGNAEDYVNVMGNSMPRMPLYPALKQQSGMVKGYVADLSGKPLKGAYIGVRITQDGGYYTSAATETDINGYYEIKVPIGSADFYATGYTISYGEGYAPVSLYPADGKLESFAAASGSVENFVLLSYGIPDAVKVIPHPKDEANYFGGALYLSYSVHDPSEMYTTPGELPYNAEIELTLTPAGKCLLDETKSFVINKKVGTQSFTVTNMPVGVYTIAARLKDGRPLKMRATGPYATAYLFGGVKPAEASGAAKVLYTPVFNSAEQTVVPNLGNWRSVQIKLELS